MTDAPNSYTAKYANSWALIIGIDKYKHASPLGTRRVTLKGSPRFFETALAFLYHISRF